MKISPRLVYVLTLGLLPGLALAHPGHGGASSWLAGILHPFTGLDHLAVMLAVGVWAGTLGQRARWVVPLGFVVMMVLGSLVAFMGLSLPFTELMIALSLLVIGGLLISKAHLSTPLAAVLVGAFAVFHGYAHGAEAQTVNVGYVLGFVTSTVCLHLLGIVMASHARIGLIRLSGVALALGGVCLLAL